MKSKHDKEVKCETSLMNPVEDTLSDRSHLAEDDEESENQADNSDDDVFYKCEVGNKVNTPTHQVDTDEEADTLGSNVQEPADVEVSERSTFSKPKPSLNNECLSYKTSKSIEGLSFRLRFAQAQKSLSSLFETRTLDKYNECLRAEEMRNKPSWRKQKVTNIDSQRRTVSLPESDEVGAAKTTEHHTDPLVNCKIDLNKAERFLQDIKSDARSRKCFSFNFTETAHLSLDDLSEATCTTDNDNPLSTNIATNQLSSSCSQTQPSANESPESPMRPMSPKPSSPRSAVHKREFRCPLSRANAISLILVGQNVNIIDPPEKPRSLKPKVGQQALLSPVRASFSFEDGCVDRHSHISLIPSPNANGFEVGDDILIRKQSLLF